MPAKIITEIRCSYCGETFMANRGRLYDQRRGISPYCKPECRRKGKAGKRPTLEERFLAHVKRLPNGCLECDLTQNSRGYPKMDVDGKTKSISHVAWFLHYGEWPPPDKKLDHVCHVPGECSLGNDCPHRRCAEWSHLKLVTQKENASPERSRVGLVSAARQRAKTHCPAGHEYTPENTISETQSNGRPRRGCRQCGVIRQRIYNSTVRKERRKRDAERRRNENTTNRDI